MNEGTISDATIRQRAYENIIQVSHALGRRLYAILHEDYFPEEKRDALTALGQMLREENADIWKSGRKLRPDQIAEERGAPESKSYAGYRDQIHGVVSHIIHFHTSRMGRGDTDNFTEQERQEMVAAFDTATRAGTGIGNLNGCSEIIAALRKVADTRDMASYTGKIMTEQEAETFADDLIRAIQKSRAAARKHSQ